MSLSDKIRHTYKPTKSYRNTNQRAVIRKEDVKEFIKELKDELGDNRDSDGIGYYTFDFIHSKINKLAGDKLI